MNKILIFSTAVQESELIKQKLIDSIQEVTVETVLTESDMMKYLVLNSVSVIILNFDTVTQQRLQMAKDLRTLGNTSAIVVLAPTLENSLLKKTEKVTKSTVIQKPVRRNDLIGVIQKYILEQSVSQRHHERYHTDAPTQIESFGSEGKTSSRMLNVSRTGAYLQCADSPGFAVGDLVRVDVQLSDLKKVRSVHAKVVWISQEGETDDRFGTGVCFIPEREVYKHMLNMV
ncbi:MAG: PilZ domain-containing protein [Pseudomonadota bacterium]|nr:PilZ domain-containing protein [Pseudomonadota bacterium]